MKSYVLQWKMVADVQGVDRLRTEISGFTGIVIQYLEAIRSLVYVKTVQEQ